MTRTAVMTLGLSVCAAAGVVGAPARQDTALCDKLAAAVRAYHDVPAGQRTFWSFVTAGPASPIELATVRELSLEPGPAADERVQFEKRFRALYGNAEAVLKDLRDWDDFDIVTLPGSAVRMLLTVDGPAQCETRYFFRVTTSREVVRVPDPPRPTSSDDSNAICESLGGWGYLARIGGTEVFLEYHSIDRRESLRIVPLSNDGWRAACPIAPAGRRASARRVSGGGIRRR